MDNKIHDLDEGILEYFDFKLFGKQYRFRQLNTEEIQALSTFENDTEKLNAYLYKFITKIDQDAPDFIEVAKKMTIPHLNRFREMVREEFGVDVKK